MSLPAAYAILLVAIAFEVAGTSALLACERFTRPGPSAIVILCYSVALALISNTFRTLPLGIVYALWSGIGIVMVASIGWIGFGQPLDAPALVGVGLILAGVLVVNLSGSIGP